MNMKMNQQYRGGGIKISYYDYGNDWRVDAVTITKGRSLKGIQDLKNYI